ELWHLVRQRLHRFVKVTLTCCVNLNSFFFQNCPETLDYESVTPPPDLRDADATSPSPCELIPLDEVLVHTDDELSVKECEPDTSPTERPWSTFSSSSSDNEIENTDDTTTNMATDANEIVDANNDSDVDVSTNVGFIFA